LANETLQVIDKNVTSCSPGLMNIVVASRRDAFDLNLSHMQPPDFLHKDAETKLCEHFIAAGAVCRLSTNSERVLDAAHKTFEAVESQPGPVDFCLRFWVDEADLARAPWPKPYVRGLDHLVFAGFDEGSSMLADLRGCHVIGRFSPAMASDLTYWQTVIFPILLTIVSASVGIAELHCACVANDRDGVLLAGPSGSGKSTLAFALSQQGFGFLSDDRTLCSLKNGEVTVWGIPTPLKLRPEAALWFDELRAERLSDSRSGGPAFWFEPERLIGVERVRQCRPTSLIFLERWDTSEFRFSPMSPQEALVRLNGELMAEPPEAAAKRSGTIKRIVDLPCWLLQYGGQPQRIAQQICRHLVKS
jgi:hypothetical protein